jgi:hypothetical protein
LQPNRTRLAIAKADKMMLVRNAYRLKHHISNNDKEEEMAFWIKKAAEEESE